MIYIYSKHRLLSAYPHTWVRFFLSRKKIILSWHTLHFPFGWEITNHPLFHGQIPQARGLSTPPNVSTTPEGAYSSVFSERTLSPKSVLPSATAQTHHLFSQQAASITYLVPKYVHLDFHFTFQFPTISFSLPLFPQPIDSLQVLILSFSLFLQWSQAGPHSIEFHNIFLALTSPAFQVPFLAMAISWSDWSWSDWWMHQSHSSVNHQWYTPVSIFWNITI